MVKRPAKGDCQSGAFRNAVVLIDVTPLIFRTYHSSLSGEAANYHEVARYPPSDIEDQELLI